MILTTLSNRELLKEYADLAKNADFGRYFAELEMEILRRMRPDTQTRTSERVAEILGENYKDLE